MPSTTGFGPADLTTEPAFPEDIERAITETLLDDGWEMCSTMSLVAARFYLWTKPIRFRTVIVHRRHKNWLKQIRKHLLPNARFIHVLALDLLLKNGELLDVELWCIQQLLEGASCVKHLAIGWRLWARLERKCGALRLRSIYFMWDGAWPYPRPSVMPPPSLQSLQHPIALKDITVQAPADLDDPVAFYTGRIYLPATRHCPNLVYVTYLADRIPVTLASLCENTQRAAVRFVGVGVPKESVDGRTKMRIKAEKERYPNLSTAYISHASQVLGEWVGKSEGRRSVLRHPALRAAE
ncbi:hypothetical protein DFH06DRAFT_1411676 [Mycena polygramma]|nr:hypothetical protein DFH06DRAFT_1411676 [Mycena polygramma]